MWYDYSGLKVSVSIFVMDCLEHCEVLVWWLYYLKLNMKSH